MAAVITAATTTATAAAAAAKPRGSRWLVNHKIENLWSFVSKTILMEGSRT